MNSQGQYRALRVCIYVISNYSHDFFHAPIKNGANAPFNTFSKNSLFFPYTLKRIPIGLNIHELTVIGIPLHPCFCFWVKNLRAFFNSTVTMPITFRWVCSH